MFLLIIIIFKPTHLTFVGTSPLVYSSLPYDVHTVTVQALSGSSTVTIVQKGKFISVAFFIILYIYKFL